jgi:hypothetical protein
MAYNKSIKQENLQLAVFTAFNILASYKFPLIEALGLQMSFERIQSQSHKIENSIVEACYDRFTTKFELIENNETLYSSYLCFRPIRKKELLINGTPFTLKIFWFVLWQSKLENNYGIVVKELLPRRRKRSIGLLIYLGIITSVKIGLVVLSQT